MKVSRSCTFEYSVEDIKNLIKRDIQRQMTNDMIKCDIYFRIESEPGFDGP